MYCAFCGKPIVQDGQFCAHCGKAVTPISQSRSLTSTEWEYTFFKVSWKPGKGGRFPLTVGGTEYGARLDNWGSDQNWILPEVQKYLDRGWIPVSDVGPGGYHFITHDSGSGRWLEVTRFLVEFRRPATPLTDIEKQLLGVWHEAKKSNAGGWSKLWEKSNTKRWGYEFFKDRTFIRVNPVGDRVQGVYAYSKDSEFILRLKFGSDDFLATLRGDRLICAAKGYETREFERADMSD